MKKILFFVIAFTVSILHSQDVEFTARVSKETLGVNERLRIEFKVNRDGDNFTPPSFKDFTLVMGPTQSVADVWINGVRTISKAYGYILQPNAKGKFTIGQATIEVDGKTYKTSPIQITVTDAVKTPSMDPTTSDIIRDNLFLVAEVSKPNPYLNEAVSVIYKLYVGGQVGLVDFDEANIPKYPDFWSHEIRMDRYKHESCTFQGKPYRCVEIKKMVLYPQKTGKITLEPLTVDAILNVQTMQRDVFRRPIIQQVVQRVTSSARSLDVRELPTEGKPEGFSGAVGNFDFVVSATKKELKATESLQVKVEVSGSGNLKLFEIPKPVFPASLEVYNPEQKENISTSLSGMRGSTTMTYTVVPQYRGKYPVSEIVFSYFNPDTGKYEVKKSEPILVEVTEGSDGGGQNTPAVVKQDVQTQGNQFRFLQLNSDLQPVGQRNFFGSMGYYLCLFLPLLIIPILLLFWKIRKNKENDVEGSKARVANRLAKKYLGEAKQKINDKNTFYEALERALHNYLKAKLKIETAEMSKEKISDLLAGKQVDTTRIENFINLLKNCELARYSNQHTASELDRDYQSAVQVLSDLDKQIKK